MDKKDNLDNQNFYDSFIGLDRVKAKLRRIEILLGIKTELKEFADNTAALAGKLKPGDFYRTASVIKVVL